MPVFPLLTDIPGRNPMPHFTIQELNLICIYDPGTRTGLIAELTKQMKDASRRLEFEQAAFIRDRIKEIREQ